MNRWRTIALCVFLGVSSLSAAQMHDHAASAAGDGQFDPFVISDNRGGFYLSYVERKGGVSDVLFQHATAGSGFSSGVRVSARSGDGTVRNENPPKIAVGPGNDVYVVWANERERWKGNIRFARSTDGGKSFELPIDLNSVAAHEPVGRAFQSIVVDPKGRIVVAWIDERNKSDGDRGAEIWMAISEDHGRTFTHDRKIVSGVCECCRTALSLDSAGRIYLSYRLVPDTGPMYRDIAVARSDDGGKSFKSVIVSHDGWELNACPIAGASMTIDAADHIHVIWFTQHGDQNRLYLATSVDHGLSFSKPGIFDPGQKLAKHAHAVSVSGNRLLIAWDDVNGTSMVKWGFFDTIRRTMQVVGSRSNESYPIIAMSGDRISLVALQPDGAGLFRNIQQAGR